MVSRQVRRRSGVVVSQSTKFAGPPRRNSRQQAKRTMARRVRMGIQNYSAKKGPFPANKIVVFPFADNVSTAGFTVGVPTPYIYQLNSLYDPNFTGTGTSVEWMDTLLGAEGTNAPYKTYQVKEVGWKVSCCNLDANGTSSARLCLTFTNDVSSYPNTLEAAYMNPETICSDVMFPYSSGKGQVTLKGKIPISRIIGNTYAKDVQSSALYNGNPSGVYGAYMICQIFPINEGSTSVLTYVLRPEFSMYTLLSNRNEQPTS